MGCYCDSRVVVRRRVGGTLHLDEEMSMEPSREELDELTRKAQKAVAECKPGQTAYLLVPVEVWSWLEESDRLEHPEREAEWYDKQTPMDEALDKGYVID